MIIDYSLAGLVTAGLLFYLTYALLRPRSADPERTFQAISKRDVP